MARRGPARWRRAALPALLLLPACAPRAPSIPFEAYRLPNGLRVILHEDPRRSISRVEVWYRVGSKDERPGRTGLAHLFEHLMFQGARHVPEDAHFLYLQEAGASAVNGTTDLDRTRYFETVPAGGLPLALWLESGRMGFLLDRPGFGASFEGQRDVVRNERRQRVENASLGDVERVLREALYPDGHPYGHEVIGSMSDLRSATEADAREFFARWYAPENAILAVAGRFDRAETRGLIERFFGPIPPGPPRPAAAPPAAVELAGERRVPMEAGVELPAGFLAWHSVPRFAAGDAELEVLAEILAGGRDARLSRRLVDEGGLAHAVSARQSGEMLAGTFEIRFTARRGRRHGEVERVLDEELARIRREPPSREEVEGARNQIEARLLRRLRSAEGRVAQLLAYEFHLGDPGFLARDLARYRSVDAQGVRRWAERVLRPDARVVVAVEPAAGAPRMGRVRGEPAPRPAPPISPAGEPPRVSPRASPDEAFRRVRPLPGPEPALRLPPVRRFRLENGLRVLLVESHDLPLVRLDLRVAAGGAADPRDLPGLAAATAEMLAEGAGARTALEVARDLSRLGAALAVETRWDETSVAIDALSGNADEALAIWADVVRRPAMAPDRFGVARERLRAALARRRERSGAERAMERALWGEGHRFARPIEGTEDALRRMAAADCRRFHEAWYRPDGAVLAVTGDATEASLRARLGRLLGGWAPGAPAPARPPAPAGPGRTRILLVDSPGAPQSSIRVGRPGYSPGDPDRPAADVMSLILGGPFERLGRNLRKARGWTYGVRASFEPRRGAGEWVLAGDFQSDRTTDALREVLREIRRIVEEEVSDEELAHAKAEIVRAHPARFDTPERAAAQAAALDIEGLPADFHERYLARVRDVTKAEVRAAARRYLDPGRLSIGILADRASQAAALGAIADVEPCDADGNPLPP